MAASYSSVEKMKTFIAIEIIIHMIIRYSKFTESLQLHVTTWSMTKWWKGAKKLALIIFCETLTRIQLGYQHKNQTIVINKAFLRIKIFRLVRVGDVIILLYFYRDCTTNSKNWTFFLIIPELFKLISEPFMIGT